MYELLPKPKFFCCLIFCFFSFYNSVNLVPKTSSDKFSIECFIIPLLFAQIINIRYKLRVFMEDKLLVIFKFLIEYLLYCVILEINILMSRILIKDVLYCILVDNINMLNYILVNVNMVYDNVNV